MSVNGFAHQGAYAGSTILKVRYPVSDTRSSHVRCMVGGLPAVDQVFDGCLQGNGSVMVGSGGVLYDYSYDIEADNKNGRSIAGFSTSAQSKMLEGCPGCPYDEFMKYYDYYGEPDYVH